MGSWMAALLLGAPAAAPAADAGPPAARVAVVAEGHCDAASSAIAARSFRAALQPKLRAVLQDESETARPLGGLAERTLEEIDRATAAARKDFYAHKVEPAVALLRALAVDVVRIAPSEQRWRAEREVATLLAQAQLAADAAAAEATLAGILKVEPGYQPDTSLYPPTFRKFVDGVRERVAELAVNRLDVAVAPPGTAVYVGGRSLGVAPVSLHLPVAEYRVEADFGHRGLVRLVRVPAPPSLVPPLELAAAVEGAVYPDAGPCLDTGSDPAAGLARLASLIGASKLFAVGSESSGERVWIRVREVDAAGAVLREARAPVQPGAPESDTVGALVEWTTTGRAGAGVEVVQRSRASATPGVRGQISGGVVGDPPPTGFTLYTFPEGGQWVQGDGIRFSGDRFKWDAPAGRTSVRVVTEDGRVGTAVVDVPAGAAAEVQVRVQKACVVTGRVLARGGHPVAGARVRAEQVGTRSWQSVETGPRGFFVFRELLRADYRVSVEGGGRRTTRQVSLGSTCSADLGALVLPDALLFPGGGADAGVSGR